ncbi:MAG: HEPN domain-containing protein [Clostridiales bacterium]|nr:HEPN domain-containing protein [Clostridiales bacterium]
MYYGAQGGMPKLHDLSFLLNQIKNQVEIEDKFYEYADTLTPYGVSIRYPNELFLEERHADKAIQYADEIVQWVSDIVNTSGDVST